MRAGGVHGVGIFMELHMPRGRRSPQPLGSEGAAREAARIAALRSSAAKTTEKARRRTFRALEQRGYLEPGEIARITGYSAATVCEMSEGRRPVPEAFVIVVEIALRMKPGRLRPGVQLEDPEGGDTWRR